MPTLSRGPPRPIRSSPKSSDYVNVFTGRDTRTFTLNPVPPLHSLQNLCPQLSQTCVNLRVRFPHLQHFRVTFHAPSWPLVLYQKRSYSLLAGNQHFGILPGYHGATFAA